MIKARNRWCTCRVENILTLDKLLSLWFCFLLQSILFLISQTSYRTYKIISSYELPRPIMGTIFFSIYMLSVCLACQINCVGGIKWTKHARAQSLFFFGGDTRINEKEAEARPLMGTIFLV